MNCRFCDAELPAGALFCGECGGAVGVVDAGAQDGVRPDPVGQEEDVPDEDVPDELCPQCASAVASDDIFCGECGFVLRAIPPAPEFPTTPPTTRSDTVVVDEGWSAADLTPVDPEAAVDAGAAVDAAQDSETREPPGPDVDLEATRLVTAAPVETRFVLQFSTGESVIVRGAGLVGRNPQAEPGEFVDQLVAVFDAGKSVSKTHLEFGQESGRFWVSDRYSTNGSTVRQPDQEPQRCQPGRRYFVARGTRVDIGEQFFVVS